MLLETHLICFVLLIVKVNCKNERESRKILIHYVLDVISLVTAVNSVQHRQLVCGAVQLK